MCVCVCVGNFRISYNITQLMISFSHSLQVYPHNLLKATYQDPHTKTLKARSELERRGRYIDMLHGKFADLKHALVVMIKGCLEYEPVKRPTARQVLERLGEMGECTNRPFCFQLKLKPEF